MKTLLAAALLVVVLAGCDAVGITCACTHAPTLPAGSLTREAATTAVLGQAAPITDTQPTIVFANVSTNPYDGSTALVWEVRLEGGLTAPRCPAATDPPRPLPGASPCLDGTGGMIGVVDATTGAFLGWIH